MSGRTDGRRRSCDKNDSNIIGAKVAPPSEGKKKGMEQTAPDAVLLLHPSQMLILHVSWMRCATVSAAAVWVEQVRCTAPFRKLLGQAG